jgi:hypothetical protein
VTIAREVSHQTTEKGRFNLGNVPSPLLDINFDLGSYYLSCSGAHDLLGFLADTFAGPMVPEIYA